MSTKVTKAAWKSWRPAEYVREYCGQGVGPDDQAALRFQVDFLRRAGRVFPRAVEYGCGPTLMRAIAAAPYVGSLDMADRLPGNLARVRRWAAADPRADDWGPFSEYVLRCEGAAEPGPALVRARERRARRVLSQLLVTDARRRHPLGPGRAAGYDLLVSGFCLECVSGSRAVWQRCLGNVLGLLRPGGWFVLAALRRSRGYRVGDRWFPAADISPADLTAALGACGADSGSLRVEECDLPTHAGQGYRGILLASGRIAGDG